MQESGLFNGFTHREWRTIRRALRRTFWAAVLIGFFLIAVPGLRPNEQDGGATEVLGYARNYLFDFAGWEGGTLFDKAMTAIIGPQRYMSEADQVRYVDEYLELVADARAVEANITLYYTNPDIEDPETASAAQRDRRDELRAEQAARQSLAEAIVQDQVAETLVDYGFGTAGMILPPPAIRFTELPSVLIISPRDHIERIGGYPLEGGIPIETRENIEAEIDGEMDLSSLITPIGGLAMWPAMLIESSYAPTVYDVSAHEWTHHLLSFYPLGFNYGANADLYTMNETVASIVGTEIGWAVLDRYYPDLAGDPPDYSPQAVEAQTIPPPPDDGDTPVFDFNAEMRETRIRADALLAAGEIDKAERYMEARRRVFLDNGYNIRKLNQAYFAFHGSYADQPGATGANPIGPALRELRYYSGSLHDFIATVRGMTTFNEMQAALEARRAAAGVTPYDSN